MIKSTGDERIPRKRQKLRRLDMKSVSVEWKVLDKELEKVVVQEMYILIVTQKLQIFPQNDRIVLS